MVIDVMVLSPPTFHRTNAHISYMRGRSTITFKLTFMCKKFHIHLLSKTLVSRIDKKNDRLSMDPD